MENKNKTVFDWVLIAKGIGIILVAIGHFNPNASPEYWRSVRIIIYSFHMPLFFLLSGFLYQYAKYPYSTLIKIKIRRLVYPFFSIAAIFLLIKYPSGIFFDLKHPLEIKSVYALILDPTNSFKPLLWFVHALFIIFCVYPLIRSIISSNIMLLILFVLINITAGNNYPVIGRALFNIPFFIVGVIFRESSSFRDKLILGKWMHVACSLFVFLGGYILFEKNRVGPQDYVTRFILGATGSICLMNISLLIDQKRGKGLERILLKKIGLFSMTIYLFHTFFESTIRVVIYQVLHVDYIPFEIIAGIAILAGIVFPLLLEKMILRKNKLIMRYILGLDPHRQKPNPDKPEKLKVN